MAKPETIQKKWYLIDADGQVLGRLASQVAAILRGKNKPEFTPNVDTGDHVVIINTDKVVLTGKSLNKSFIAVTPASPAISRKSSTASLWRKEAISPSCRQSRVCFPKQSRSGNAQKGARLQGRGARAAGAAAAAFDIGGLIEVNYGDKIAKSKKYNIGARAGERNPLRVCAFAQRQRQHYHQRQGY